MVDTNSRRHVVERTILGICGSTLVVLPAMLNWIDASDPLNASRWVPWGYGATLMIAWGIAIWAAAREPDPHWWGCLFKSVGVPGSIISLGQVFQVPT